jgi:hypothetical protein
MCKPVLPSKQFVVATNHLLFCAVLAGAIVVGCNPGLAAQTPPAIQWQSLIGGNQEDKLSTVAPAPDGGFLLGGITYSPASGNKTSTNYGQMDFWLVRLDDTGHKQWDRTYGGSASDSLSAIVPGADANTLLCGYSYSDTNSVRTAPHYGSWSDYWIVLVDTNGLKLWDRAFGGTADDFLQAACSTPDGGYLLGGYSHSGTDGTKTAPNRGNSDFWLVRTDATGGQLWDRTYGGTGYDSMHAMLRLEQGGYLLLGDSNSSTNGNKTAPYLGDSDYWLVAVDADGNKLWDKTYGGTGTDYAYAILALPDGGFLLGGLSNSGINGTKTAPNRGGFDYWIVRIDGNGNQLWDRSFGGANDDSLLNLTAMYDGGFLLGGISGSSTNGNKTALFRGGNTYWGDFWAVRIDALGNRIWDESYGGLGDDAMYAACSTSDGGTLLAGWSNSPGSGNKAGNSFGMADFWVAKLAAEPPAPIYALRTAGIFTNDFSFNCLSSGSGSVLVEYSTNLNTGWQALQTNTLAGTNPLIHAPHQVIEPQRYFRLRLLP